MSKPSVRVAVNGYGVIGKRVADAVMLQDDMELVGVCDVISDYRIRLAVERGYPVYAATSEAGEAMSAESIPIAGGLEDLLAEVDVVVDCTPKKVGAQNRPMYQQRGLKSIWQGVRSTRSRDTRSSHRSIMPARSAATRRAWCRATPRRSAAFRTRCTGTAGWTAYARCYSAAALIRGSRTPTA